MKHQFLISILLLGNIAPISAMSAPAILAASRQLAPVQKTKSLCAICLEHLYDKEQIVVRLPCSKKHVFHYQCIARAHDNPRDRRCPLCRAETAEHIADPKTIEILSEQLAQETMDRKHLELVSHFKGRELAKLTRENKKLKERASQLEQQLEQHVTQAFVVVTNSTYAPHRRKRHRHRNRARQRAYEHTQEYNRDAQEQTYWDNSPE